MQKPFRLGHFMHWDMKTTIGLQLSCYFLYLKATGNLEMKKIESNSSNLYLNIAILYNAYQIFRCSHTYYHRNCNLKMWNKFYLPTSCTLTVHIFWFRPLKRCIRIHYRSASIRKSQENLWIIIYLGLPCAFQDWFWHNYRQYILESQLNCYFEYFASKGQQAKIQIGRAFSFKAIVGNVRSLRQKIFHTIVTIVPDIDGLFRLCPFINILGWNACKI